MMIFDGYLEVVLNIFSGTSFKSLKDMCIPLSEEDCRGLYSYDVGRIHAFNSCIMKAIKVELSTNGPIYCTCLIQFSA